MWDSRAEGENQEGKTWKGSGLPGEDIAQPPGEQRSLLLAWLELAHGCWANHGQLRPSESRCKGRGRGEREEPWGQVGVVLVVLASVLCVTMQGYRQRGWGTGWARGLQSGWARGGVWSLFPRAAWGKATRLQRDFILGPRKDSVSLK